MPDDRGLTPDEVRALEVWLMHAYDGAHIPEPVAKIRARRVMPPDIAAIVSKLCDRFWHTINESRRGPDGR